MQVVGPALGPVLQGVGLGVKADVAGLRGVAGRSGVIGGERGLVVLVWVPENDAEFLFQGAAADQAVEVEVTALVPAVA